MNPKKKKKIMKGKMTFQVWGKIWEQGDAMSTTHHKRVQMRQSRLSAKGYGSATHLSISSPMMTSTLYRPSSAANASVTLFSSPQLAPSLSTTHPTNINMGSPLSPGWRMQIVYIAPDGGVHFDHPLTGAAGSQSACRPRISSFDEQSPTDSAPPAVQQHHRQHGQRVPPVPCERTKCYATKADSKHE